ncbi:MAG: cupin domain-containing protein [Alphaproteobacteria bacterium]|nr:cupin domain-containing protein [Alphaproteobacteria bacterium]
MGVKDRKDRRVVAINTAPLEVYDLEGPVQPEIGLLNLSYDRARGEGVYFMRMSPGAVTIEHTHAGFEDFLILEGEVIESDGTVLRAGDVVSYAPGTRHNTRTETGCVLIGFDWKPA